MGVRFVRGSYLFTIDCNQDGWVFETMKVPLLVRENLYPRRRMKCPGWFAAYEDDPENTVVLVGVPEEIITEEVSPVGSAEAVAESVFGRLQQRVFD